MRIPLDKRRLLGSCEEGDRGYCERINGNGEREYWDSKNGVENYTKWSGGEEVKEKPKTEWECVNAETESYLTEIVKRYIQLNEIYIQVNRCQGRAPETSFYWQYTVDIEHL